MIRSHFAGGVTEQGDMQKGSFQRMVPKWFCRIQGFMSVKEIVNRSFIFFIIIFAFSLYKMLFFTPP